MYTRPTVPRSIGGVLDDAIRLYTASLRVWLVPSVIGAALIALAGGWVALRLGGRTTPAQLAGLFRSPAVWGGYAALILLSIWVNFAIIAGIVRVARGEAATVRATLLDSLRVFPHALLGSILSGMAIMVGILALIIPGIYLAGRWMYWGVSLLDEPGSSAIDALGRSWQLSAGNWWRGITILTIAFVLLIVLSMVGSFCVGIVIGVAHLDVVTAIVVSQALQAVVSVFVNATAPAAFAAIYYDLQLRREGGDLAARVSSLAPT